MNEPSDKNHRNTAISDRYSAAQLQLGRIKMHLPIRVMASMLVTATLSGCVTIKTLSEDKPCNKIYSGTIGNLTDGWWLGHSLFLDVPFSFVLDTVVLPYAIPKTIINYSLDDAACKKTTPAR